MRLLPSTVQKILKMLCITALSFSPRSTSLSARSTASTLALVSFIARPCSTRPSFNFTCTRKNKSRRRGTYAEKRGGPSLDAEGQDHPARSLHYRSSVFRSAVVSSQTQRRCDPSGSAKVPALHRECGRSAPCSRP